MSNVSLLVIIHFYIEKEKLDKINQKIQEELRKEREGEKEMAWHLEPSYNTELVPKIKPTCN